MNDNIERELANAHVPNWVLNWLAPVVGIIVVLAELLELPEKFGLEPPRGGLIAGSLAGFLFWVWIIHHAHRWRPAVLWLIGLLAVLFLIEIPRIWLAYIAAPGAQIPALASYAIAIVCVAIFLIALSLGYKGRVNLAVGFGGVIAVVFLLMGIFWPEDWYFLVDTQLVQPFEDGCTGILIAPYDRDADSNEHRRLSEQLLTLLSREQLMRHKLCLKLLPRRIPGYVTSGSVSLLEDTEQEDTARRVGYYLSSRIVTYGVRAGDYTKTRIVLIGFDKQDLLFPLHEIDVEGRATDARFLHFLSAEIAGVLEFAAGRYTNAEALFNVALKDATELPVSVNLNRQPVPQLNLLKGINIAHEIHTAVAPIARVDDALGLLKSVMDDPNSNARLRMAAANSAGFLLRNLSQSHSDPTLHKRNLDDALAAYMSVLTDIPPDADPYAVAAVWNGVGVVYEKLAEHSADPLRDLGHAGDAYLKALEWFKKADTSKNPGVGTGVAAVANNLAITVMRQATAEHQPERLKQAIGFFIEARAALKMNPDIKFEPLMVSNLADAYRHLAEYEDRGKNLIQARSLLAEALGMEGAKSYPAVRGEIIFKFGQVDVAAGREGGETQIKRGIREFACSFDIFDRAGRAYQVEIVLNALRNVAHETPAIVMQALQEVTAPFPDCTWDPGKVIQRLSQS
jgi:tetratricopeptide (TPR) repeat protein